MKSILDAISVCYSFTIDGSTFSISLPCDYPVSVLAGFGFYISGEIFNDRLWVHGTLHQLANSLLVATSNPHIRYAYKKQTRRSKDKTAPLKTNKG